MKHTSALPWPLRFQRNTRIIELFAKGATLREMADEAGLSHPAVIVILNEVGLTCADRNAKRAKDLTKMLTKLDDRYARIRGSLAPSVEQKK